MDVVREEDSKVEVTRTQIWAEFVPLPDLTAHELAQAHAVIGEYRTFTNEEWEALGISQRHWTERDWYLMREGPGGFFRV